MWQELLLQTWKAIKVVSMIHQTICCRRRMEVSWFNACPVVYRTLLTMTIGDVLMNCCLLVVNWWCAVSCSVNYIWSLDYVRANKFYSVCNVHKWWKCLLIFKFIIINPLRSHFQGDPNIHHNHCIITWSNIQSLVYINKT